MTHPQDTAYNVQIRGVRHGCMVLSVGVITVFIIIVHVPPVANYIVLLSIDSSIYRHVSTHTFVNIEELRFFNHRWDSIT